MSKYVSSLAQLFSTDVSLVQEIELAILNPKKYEQNFLQEMLERGINYKFKKLPWLALVMG